MPVSEARYKLNVVACSCFSLLACKCPILYLHQLENSWVNGPPSISQSNLWGGRILVLYVVGALSKFRAPFQIFARLWVAISEVISHYGYLFPKFYRIIGLVLEKVLQIHKNYKKLFIITTAIAQIFITFTELWPLDFSKSTESWMLAFWQMARPR